MRFVGESSMADRGKEAEKKIRTWLDRPEDGYSFDRIPDQMNGFYGGRNICDFTCFKSPYMYYIESKETEKDNFAFRMITETQYNGLLEKSKIDNCFGLVIVLFTWYKRAFIFRIEDIDRYQESTGKKSLNIRKIDDWSIPYVEIDTIPSRKIMLDYSGDIEEHVVVRYESKYDVD